MDHSEAINLIKTIFEDGEAEIHGRKYIFTKTVHKKRRKVFAFMTKIQGMMASGDMSWLDWDEYEKIEQVMFDIILFDGMQLSKSSNHFEQYPEDYLMLIPVAIQVITYPLLAAGGLN